MEKHQPYFNLLDALKENTCPVCFLVKTKIHKSMDDFLYEKVNDPGVRQEIRKSFGYCNTHAWQLQKMGDGFGLSLIYADLFNLFIGQLEGFLADKKKSSAARFKNLFRRGTKVIETEKNKSACPICKECREIEKRYISLLIEHFDDAEFYVHFKQSLGLCIPHLSTTLELCKDKRIARELISIEAGKMRSLKKELEEFAAKHDYRFSKGGFGKEGDSWVRAIEKITGKEGIY